MTQTVVLTMGLAAYTCESVTLYNALKTFTFGYSDNIYERNVLKNVRKRNGVTELKLPFEVCGELHKLAFRGGSCLCKMALEGFAGVLFCSFVIGKLYSGITIFLYCTNLRNNARTSLNYGAWNIFSISTENGCHSDFLSN